MTTWPFQGKRTDELIGADMAAIKAVMPSINIKIG
jgi:hypothetical protein